MTTTGDRKIPAVGEKFTTGMTRLVLHLDAETVSRLKDSYRLQRTLARVDLSVAQMSPIAGLGMLITEALTRGMDELAIKSTTPTTKPRKKKRRG